jgi:hypothetical protein
LFEKESVEGLQWVFETWRRRSGFFPAISDIWALLDEWKRGQREQAELREQLKEKLTLEEAREAGLLVPYDEIRQRLLEVAEKMGFPVAPTKMQTVSMREMPPALQLTKQQIEARRPAERAECERMRRQMEEGA